MTLKHFINEVAQLLQEHLGEHYIVETATTLKNNSVELSGVQIRHKKDNIFPTIYLNDFYELYDKNSVTLEEIVDKVAEDFRKAGNPLKNLLLWTAQPLKTVRIRLYTGWFRKNKIRKCWKICPTFPSWILLSLFT